MCSHSLKYFGSVSLALEALYWAELAARQGHRAAIATRDGLAARMTPQQIAEVRHRAENFRPKG